ncbi:zinc dependent phospholipase C family protein [Pedobacter sp. BAL39]|uniref:zinc dependent phospholipase C family protein n=1 Tax=Pedobacter sp. BAL39 TaxID=391596 RepID=UPI0012F90059|nr:zinc dependent phospholipase C family protein [Pedobacter sp. BAL39]
MRPVLIFVILFLCPFCAGSWGFFAHMRINELAVFTLPEGMYTFYKQNRRYLRDHAVDPDKRRYADTSEAARHYLDVEHYEVCIDSIPRKYPDAVKKYGLKKMNQSGILPWQIQQSYYKLVRAFQQRDSAKILIYSAYLGHYLSDAQVPLHTTANHDGQLSGQQGIHAFWESRLPELFSEDYNFLLGKAQYISDPLEEAWKMVSKTHLLVDSVLQLDSVLNSSFPIYRKYGYSKRKNKVVKQHTEGYSRLYHDSMKHMVERQMREAIRKTGAYWYSAWVDAGQPTLKGFPLPPVPSP